MNSFKFLAGTDELIATVEGVSTSMAAAIRSLPSSNPGSLKNSGMVTI
jgi:hypothetical protein